MAAGGWLMAVERVTDGGWRVTDGGWPATTGFLFCQCDGGMSSFFFPKQTSLFLCFGPSMFGVSLCVGHDGYDRF